MVSRKCHPTRKRPYKFLTMFNLCKTQTFKSNCQLQGALQLHQINLIPRRSAHNVGKRFWESWLHYGFRKTRQPLQCNDNNPWRKPFKSNSCQNKFWILKLNVAFSNRMYCDKLLLSWSRLCMNQKPYAFPVIYDENSLHSTMRWASAQKKFDTKFWNFSLLQFFYVKYILRLNFKVRIFF